MRTAELLDALSQADGGVQVNVTRTRATVSTRYTPLVKGRGKTIFEAAFAAAEAILAFKVKYPDHADRLCPDVMKALEAYDRHTAFLQL